MVKLRYLELRLWRSRRAKFASMIIMAYSRSSYFVLMGLTLSALFLDGRFLLFSLHREMSNLEFLPQNSLIYRAIVLRKPGMTYNFGHWESLVGLEGQHRIHKILETITEESRRHTALMSLPEEVLAVARDQLVVGIILGSFLEWLCSRVEDENNDTEGEQIYKLALIAWLEMELWSHIAACTKLRSVPSATIRAWDAGGEAEIDDFNVIVFVNEDVFELEIPVSQILHIHGVNCEEQLPG